MHRWGSSEPPLEQHMDPVGPGMEAFSLTAIPGSFSFVPCCGTTEAAMLPFTVKVDCTPTDEREVPVEFIPLLFLNAFAANAHGVLQQSDECHAALPPSPSWLTQGYMPPVSQDPD